ncbi:MAG TPA: BlaI/MecI/CopY family transcriptional regulator [Verrucomicrobiae bacterium]|nr:BlaI/MecI/CopY family transcriptional regulator [Verrucomicrobiae bacterium]
MAKKIPRPTEAELAILRTLWRHGPGTVRQIHEQLAAGAGYTTTLKFLQIMAEKGLVTRDESERAHVYRPALAEEETQRRLLDDLLDRAFGGSAQKLVLQALSTRKPSAAERAAIRNLLDTLEDGPTR